MTDSVAIHHRSGVKWWQARIPFRLHRCRPQSWGWVRSLTFVERCACGGTRLDGRGSWLGRNTRSKGDSQEEMEGLEEILRGWTE